MCLFKTLAKSRNKMRPVDRTMRASEHRSIGWAQERRALQPRDERTGPLRRRLCGQADDCPHCKIPFAALFAASLYLCCFEPLPLRWSLQLLPKSWSLENTALLPLSLSSSPMEPGPDGWFAAIERGPLSDTGSSPHTHSRGSFVIFKCLHTPALHQRGLGSLCARAGWRQPGLAALCLACRSSLVLSARPFPGELPLRTQVARPSQAPPMAHTRSAAPGRVRVGTAVRAVKAVRRPAD